VEFKEVINKRYSCRKFSTKEVNHTTRDEIIKTGLLAPSAKNTQGVKIYALEKEDLKKVDSFSPCRYGAPLVFIFIYDENIVCPLNDERVNSGSQDATILGTYIMLASENLRLNTCWIDYIDFQKAKEVLKLNSNEKLMFMLDVGYADESSTPRPWHFERKEYNEVVKTKIEE